MYDIKDIRRGDYVVLRDDSKQLTEDVTGWGPYMSNLTASNGKYDYILALRVTRVEAEDGWITVRNQGGKRRSFTAECIKFHLPKEDAEKRFGLELPPELHTLTQKDMPETKKEREESVAEDESEPTVSDERMRELILSATGDVENGLTQDEVACIVQFADSPELPEIAKQMIEDGELRTAVDMHGGVVLVDDTKKTNVPLAF